MFWVSLEAKAVTPSHRFFIPQLLLKLKFHLYGRVAPGMKASQLGDAAVIIDGFLKTTALKLTHIFQKAKYI
jgi:hypothetical protein